METIKPYFLMTSNQLILAAYISLVSVVVDPRKGISSTILVLYEHFISVLLLASLAFHFERGKRPELTCSVVFWAFLIGFLQVPVGQLLMTSSHRYITPNFQSVALLIIPVVVFLIAVISRQEKFQFCKFYHQAKLWGVLMSGAGAFMMVLLSNPEHPILDRIIGHPTTEVRYVGYVMVGTAVLSLATSNVLMENVAVKYPAYLTLTTMANISGTLQTAAIAVLTERRPSSWRIRWSGNLQLLAILYGGMMVSGLAFYMQVWCLHKKGAVFATGFCPLLIIFSFILETYFQFHHDSCQFICSILGAILVIGGLYLFLWAKSKDISLRRIAMGGHIHSIGDSSSEQLLPSKA
ncbi:WAT1-related protein At5g07050-like [Asparagus officinalis]|uniref:WAT1-related protein At5g07050-like n=1 Tax=Asparagus officinalis TaxID=4686 RepID=UPI00098E8500|nr:WAT1-related protein At5g07050-like [Asparagus officinalis]